MAYRFLWIGALGIAFLISGLLAHQTVIGQSGDSIIVKDADAVYMPELGQFTGEHLDAPALPPIFSLSGAQKIAIFSFNAQILLRPTIGLNERIIVQGAAHIKIYDFHPPFVYQIKKDSCRTSWGYTSELVLKETLLTEAKRATVNELFGEQITSVTRLENFKLTSDDMSAISASLVRISNEQYYNGTDFAQACVSIMAYVTEEDRAKFIPGSVYSSHVCKADDNATGATLRTRARDAAVLDAVLSYDRKLDALDPADVSSLLRDAKFSADSGFDSETGAYCTSVTGQVLPIEALGLLNN